MKFGKLIFPQLEWKGVSEEAKDLIQKMLRRDYEKRWSAEECLIHPWIAGELDNIDSYQVSPEALDNLRTFHADRKLQHAALTFISINLLTAE